MRSLKFEENGESMTDPHVWHNAQNGITVAETIEWAIAQVALAWVWAQASITSPLLAASKSEQDRPHDRDRLLVLAE